MAFKLFGGGGDKLEAIEDKVQTMLRSVRHEFELAMAALLGDQAAADVNDELRSTDRKVNALEREIRRELVVHSSVFGGIDTPQVLVYMSIVKDIERIGDYSKNLIDLARDGADFGGSANAEEWRGISSEVAQFVTESGSAFGARDAARCRQLRLRGDALLDLCDRRVTELVRGDDATEQAVARALAFRYIKRVVAHLMNLLSAVIMPVDRIDYYDEDPEDRRPI